MPDQDLLALGVALLSLAALLPALLFAVEDRRRPLTGVAPVLTPVGPACSQQLVLGDDGLTVVTLDQAGIASRPHPVSQ